MVFAAIIKYVPLCVLQCMVRCSRQVSDEVLTVRHFQLASWPESSDYPAGLDVIIDLMETVEKWQQASGNSSITVHCMYVRVVKQLCVLYGCTSVLAAAISC